MELESSHEGLDRVSQLSVAEFERRYLRNGRPVVIEDAIQNWGALASWNLPYLEKQIGDCVAPIKRTCKKTNQTVLEDARLQTFFAHIGGEREHHPSDTHYLSDHRILRGNEPINEIGRLLASDLGDVPYVPPTRSGYSSLFIGGDSETTCHYHHKSEAFLVQLVGSKTVVFISPQNTRSLDRVPQMVFNFSPSQFKYRHANYYKTCEEVSAAKVELHAGQILYVPLHWWHYVYSDNFHVSLSIWFQSNWRNWKRSPVLLPSLVEILGAKRPFKLGLRNKLAVLLGKQ